MGRWQQMWQQRKEALHSETGKFSTLGFSLKEGWLSWVLPASICNICVIAKWDSHCTKQTMKTLKSQKNWNSLWPKQLWAIKFAQSFLNLVQKSGGLWTQTWVGLLAFHFSISVNWCQHPGSLCLHWCSVSLLNTHPCPMHSTQNDKGICNCSQMSFLNVKFDWGITSKCAISHLAQLNLSIVLRWTKGHWQLWSLLAVRFLQTDSLLATDPVASSSGPSVSV